MRNFLLPILLFLNTLVAAQNLYFPPITGNTWDTISPSSLGWCSDKIDSLFYYLDQRNTKAFLVLKDGKIVIEKYFGTFTKDSIWYWASAGKTLTAFTIGIAQQEGFLNIHDTTSNYLGLGWTSCTQQQEEKITIRHQLTMTTGLDDAVSDPDCTIDTCLKYKADAGTRWAYHNAPYTLLSNVIQSATGQNLNSYFTNKVKNPTGMTGLFLNNGFNTVYYSNARSMARFGLLILNKGNWNGNQIMTDTTYFNEMINTSQSLNESYGYLWWLNGKNSFMIPTLQFIFNGPLFPSAPTDMIAALGKNGQILNIVPSEKIILIRLGNPPLSSQNFPITFNDTIWQKFNEVRCTSNTINDEEIRSFNIYPNPVFDKITVSIASSNAKFAEVEIYDFTGKIVLSEKLLIQNNQLQLSCNEFQNGIYLMNVGLENEAKKQVKFIVSKN